MLMHSTSFRTNLKLIIIITILLFFSVNIVQAVPSNAISKTLNATEDAYVIQGSLDHTGSETKLDIRTYYGADHRYAFIKWNLSEIPQTATIVGYQINVYLYNWFPDADGNAIYFHRVYDYWEEAYLNWYTDANYRFPSNATFFYSISIGTCTEGWKSSYIYDTDNILQTIRGWHNGSIPNYGVRASLYFEDDHYWWQIRSKESGYAPQLIVWYLAPSPPWIISWGNNATNNNTLNVSVLMNQVVRYNATANASGTWHWLKDDVDLGINQNYADISFGSAGNHTVKVYITNANGTSNTVQWNVTVVEPQINFWWNNKTNDGTLNISTDVQNIIQFKVNGSWCTSIDSCSGTWNWYYTGAAVQGSSNTNTINLRFHTAGDHIVNVYATKNGVNTNTIQWNVSVTGYYISGYVKTINGTPLPGTYITDNKTWAATYSTDNGYYNLGAHYPLTTVQLTAVKNKVISRVVVITGNMINQNITFEEEYIPPVPTPPPSTPPPTPSEPVIAHQYTNKEISDIVFYLLPPFFIFFLLLLIIDITRYIGGGGTGRL